MAKKKTQPKIPLWSYEDESNPDVMAKKIDAAVCHGIDCFIFDWYYYEDGVFLERALEEGFLKATNRKRINYALMWANHDWIDMHPAQSISQKSKVLYPGKISRNAFNKMTDYVIDKYFKDDNYWKIDACPYFSIYELSMFIKSMGGVKQAKDALDDFRRKVKTAGFPDLHLNAIYFKVPVLQNEKGLKGAENIIRELTFDSITSYVWVHHQQLEQDFTPASKVFKNYLKIWDKIDKDIKIPYHPNITVAWDNNPRYIEDFTPVMTNTPKNFKKNLHQIKERLQLKPSKHQILTVNAWNEWTEGSYLEPDTENKFAYLEAIKSTFN